MNKSKVIQAALFVTAAVAMFLAWSCCRVLRLFFEMSLNFNRQLFLIIWNM